MARKILTGEQPTTVADNEIVSSDTAAKRLLISRRTLESWVKRYKISHLKIGRTIRFLWSDLQAELKEKFTLNRDTRN
jgi:excisionase family DNA binding protein